MAHSQPQTPTRPPRPAFLYLDPINDNFDDGQHIEYYPAEVEAAEAHNHHAAGGNLSQNPFLDQIEAAPLPASLHSSPRDSVIGYPFPDVRTRSTDGLGGGGTDSLSGFHRQCISSPDSSGTSSPLTPTYAGQWPRSRSRSPLACPPAYLNSPIETVIGSPDPSKTHSFKRNRRTFKSTALLDIDTVPLDKPWCYKKDFLEYVSYWLTISMVLFMAGLSALASLINLSNIRPIGDLCLVLEDDFENGLDRNTWFHEVDLGGFGNHEFEMMTASENNSFVQDGILYLVPTLTSDIIGKEAIFDGHSYNLAGCTNMNLTMCGAVSNFTLRKVINPVQSARLTTRHSHSIQYGRVEVRARLPRGDWLWPAIWMLPTDNEYGPWPVSGEIDIMESRGNGIEYPFQGRNYVRSSLNWGPVDFLNSVAKTFGWITKRRVDYSDDFHTFVLEWSPKFLRAYVDSRLHTTLEINFDQPFFSRGDYPPTAWNGSNEVVITNPWAESGSNSAPFDKPFYLIMDVAVGGRNGWFPDSLGGKMWFDGSDTAMYDFARAQEVWYETWPKDPTRRGMAIEYVKMWEKC